MFEVALFGAGKIGEAITALLASSGRYHIRVCDHDLKRAQQTAAPHSNLASAHQLNLDDAAATKTLLQGCKAVLSALPYFCNTKVADCAKPCGAHYFDLTEDVSTSKYISTIAEESDVAFMPQCGLAPGFIGVTATSLCYGFDKLHSLKLRTGALPIFPSNRLKYNLTWSTDGLINEYINPCEIIDNGKRQLVSALEGLESVVIHGVQYEAFNTSGGCGALATSLEGKIDSLSYKTLRYPGHRDLISFLLDDLGLRENRETLKALLEKNIPATDQDRCIIFVEVVGEFQNKLVQRSYASVVRGQNIAGRHFSAIQVTTASGICTPLDLLLTGKLGEKAKGFLKVEEISLKTFLENEFGRFYLDERAMDGL